MGGVNADFRKSQMKWHSVAVPFHAVTGKSSKDRTGYTGHCSCRKTSNPQASPKSRRRTLNQFAFDLHNDVRNHVRMQSHLDLILADSFDCAIIHANLTLNDTFETFGNERFSNIHGGH